MLSGLAYNMCIVNRKVAMKALKETTDWAVPNHTYIVEGSNLFGYIREGTTSVHWFNKPIKGFNQVRRKFEEAEVPLVNWRETLKEFVEAAEPVSWIKTVEGSKPGVTYQVNTIDKTCSCPGYTFRGDCKHIKELETA
jgi:hypothetical protein